MSNFFKHLHTVNKHRLEVCKLCFKCGIPWQGLVHDLSKYSLVEFLPQIKYWTGKKSPIDVEIEEKGYSEAWLHHKGRNKHHYEYWLDPAHMDTPVEIPRKYVVEMFCDRVAASKIYKGDEYTNKAPYEYFLSKEAVEKQLINKRTYQQLGGMFFMLSLTEHEELIFDIVKDWYKNDSYDYFSAVYRVKDEIDV